MLNRRKMLTGIAAAFAAAVAAPALLMAETTAAVDTLAGEPQGGLLMSDKLQREFADQLLLDKMHVAGRCPWKFNAASKCYTRPILNGRGNYYVEAPSVHNRHCLEHFSEMLCGTRMTDYQLALAASPTDPLAPRGSGLSQLERVLESKHKYNAYLDRGEARRGGRRLPEGLGG